MLYYRLVAEHYPWSLRLFRLATRLEIVCRVPGIVYRAIETHPIRQAGCTGAAKTAAVTLTQHHCGALNLKIQFQSLDP